MSYIRSGSNPEKLYIFGSITGKVEIYAGPPGTLPLTVPQWQWDEFMEKYVDMAQDDNFEYLGLRVEHRWINGDYKVVLYVDNAAVIMWEVTWWHILDRYTDEWYRKNQSLGSVAKRLPRATLVSASYKLDKLRSAMHNRRKRVPDRRSTNNKGEANA